MKMFKPHLRLGAALMPGAAILPLLLTLSLRTNAAEVRLIGSHVKWQGVTVQTNSVTCAAVFAATNQTLHAMAESDSALAFVPPWDKWHALAAARLDIWAEAVADGSNVVSILCGNIDSPALAIHCSDDWSLQPAGTVSFDPLTPAAYGVVTQALHLTIYPGNDFGHVKATVRSRDVNCTWHERQELAPSALGWVAAEPAIQNWQEIGVALAGPAAELRLLRMRWLPEGTIMVFK